MAKVTGPLMSMDARGALGKAIVFMGWRGVKDVRMYHKPSNPKTEDQLAWRALFSDAVNFYQSLDPADQSAWRRSASGKPLSGYNLMIKYVLAVLKATEDWLYINEVTIATPGDTDCVLSGDTGASSLITCLYGTSPGYYPYSLEESAGRSTPGAFTLTLTGLTKSTNYYFYMETEDTGVGSGRSGEFTFKTAAS